jgi:two-component system NarL family sensor kinase
MMTGRRGGSRPEVRAAIQRFLLLSAVAMLVVGGVAIAASMYVARTQAVDDAAQGAHSIATFMVGPLCTPAMRQGDPSAMGALDTAVRNRMRDGSILRIKIWSPEGKVLYSDAAALIGGTYELDEGDRNLLGTHQGYARISSLERPENTLERPAGRLVETYVGFFDTAGQPLLFEAYFPVDGVDAKAARIAWQLTPICLLTIVSLQLLQLPLALVLARRLDHAHSEHERLLEHAVAASDLERRRVARDLHDGVIQDLAGVGYTLESVELQLAPDSPRLQQVLRRAAGVVQADVRALRQTMTDLHPADLTEVGLASAINDLVEPARAAGLSCTVQIADTSDLPPLAVQVLYRASRELVRNTLKHAQATEVSVNIEVDHRRATLTVTDNGVGFSGQAAARKGHLGLRLLTEAVRDAGGTVEVITAPGAGTTVRIIVVAS